MLKYSNNIQLEQKNYENLYYLNELFYLIKLHILIKKINLHKKSVD